MVGVMLFFRGGGIIKQLKILHMEQNIELLKMAAKEIKLLRRQNELQAARLEVFDKMILLLHTLPNYPSQGMGEDLAWKIDQYITANEQ